MDKSSMAVTYKKEGRKRKERGRRRMRKYFADYIAMSHTLSTPNSLSLNSA